MNFRNGLALLLAVLCTTSVTTTDAFMEEEGTAFSFSSLLSRVLALGDFDTFNNVLRDVTLVVPDPQPFSMNLLFPLTIQLTNLSCRGLSIGDIVTNYTLDDSNTELTFAVDLFPFSMECYGNYAYDYSFFSSSGALEASASNNRLQVALGFRTPSNFDVAPPNETTVSSCEANIDITNLDLSGGIESVIASIFEDAVSDLVSNEAAKAFCKNAETVFNFLDELLQRVNKGIDTLEGPQSEVDPLQPERDLDIATDANVINLRYGGGSLASTIRNLINETDSFLSEVTVDPDDPTKKDLTINNWLRDNLLNEDGVLLLKAEDFGGVRLFQSSDRLFKTNIELISIMVKGLDSFSVFNPIDFIGNYTIQNEFFLQSLSVEAVIRLEIQSSTQEDSIVSAPEPVSAVETVTLGVDVSDLDVSLAAMIAANLDKLGKTELGSLMQLKTILPCVVKGMEGLEFSGLKVALGSMGRPSFEGIGSPGFSRVITSIIDAVFDMYKPTFLRVLPAAFQGPLRSTINGRYIEPIVSGEKDACSRLEAESDSAYIDFRDLLRNKSQALLLGASGDSPYGDLVPWVWNLIDERFIQPNETTGLTPLNEQVITPWTKRQSGIEGTWAYPGSLIDEYFTFFLINMEFGIRIYDLLVENLDTVGTPFSPLNPVQGEAQTLNNVATVGVAKPLRLSGSLFFSVASGDSAPSIKNELTMSLSVESFSVLLDLVLNIIANSLFMFPVKDIANLDCLLATLQQPSLDAQGVRRDGEATPFSLLNVKSTFESLQLNVTCIECGSPKMVELTERLASPEGIKDGTDLANTIMDIISEGAGPGFVALTLDRRIADARLRCPHSPEYSPNATNTYEPFESSEPDQSYKFLIGLAIAVVLLGIVIFAYMTFVKYVVRRRHQKWLQTLSNNRVAFLWQHQESEKAREGDVNNTSASLYASTDVPQVARIAIPIIILGNIGLFLAGHICSAASVNLAIAFAGDVYKEAGFYEFSIAAGTINLWKAGGYELAILIVLFSVIWPYVKQFISLFLWFASPTACSTSKRLNTYLWLDVLAKWSMVDIFTLLVTLVAFRVTINSPEIGFLPEEFYKIDFSVMPMIGLYANFVAQVVSQISSHFIIHYHRKVVREAKRRLGEDVSDQESHYDNDSRDAATSNPCVSLASHAFSRPHRGENERIMPRRFVSPLVGLGAIVITVFVLIGCSLPAFSAEILGLFGLIVESGQKFEAAITKYSMFDMMKVLFKQAELTDLARDYIGLASLSALLLVTVLFAPILQAALLVYQWFRPLTVAQRKRLLVANEIIQAWQYTEVFALSIIFGAWQLSSVSHYMLNIFCEDVTALQNLFGELTYLGVLKPQDAQCFQVESKIEIGFIFLAAAALLLALLNTFVCNAVVQYLRELDESRLVPYMATTEKQASADEVRSKVDPPVALFTDRFRWCLTSNLPPTYHSSGPLDGVNPSKTMANHDTMDVEQDAMNWSRSMSDFDEVYDTASQQKANDRFEQALFPARTSPVVPTAGISPSSSSDSEDRHTTGPSGWPSSIPSSKTNWSNSSDEGRSSGLRSSTY